MKRKRCMICVVLVLRGNLMRLVKLLLLDGMGLSSIGISMNLYMYTRNLSTYIFFVGSRMVNN